MSLVQPLLSGGMVWIGAEITTLAWVDMEAMARHKIRDVGYNRPEIGCDWESSTIGNWEAIT